MNDPQPQSDHVILVLGHRSSLKFGIHMISDQCVARVRHAEKLAAELNVRAVMLSGWGMTGDSEAKQMARIWQGGSVPLVLEELSTNTAENATRSLDLIQAMPGVTRVTVVTSAWHMRTPYFFRHYADHGIKVDFRFAPVELTDWPKYLAYELKALHDMRSMGKRAWKEAGHIDCRRSQPPPDVAA